MKKNQQRKGFIGVRSSKSKAKEITKHSKLFWCTWKSYGAVPDDLLFMYVGGTGIRYVLKIVDVEAPEEIACSLRGMSTITVQHLYSLDNPITYKEIKDHEVLAEMAGARRRFQGTIFQMTNPEVNAVVSEIKKRDPSFMVPLG